MRSRTAVIAAATAFALSACGSTAPAPPAVSTVASQVQPGPTDSGVYRTVAGTEHADEGRSRLFSDAVFGGSSDPDVRNQVVSRTAPGRYPGPYNLLTRGRDELFVYYGSYGGVDGAAGPAVARLDADTLEEVWRTEVQTLPEGSWNYPGVLGVHGNGDLYLVAANAITRLDPDTGDVLDRADLPTDGATDSTYNGYATTSDGTIVTKAIYREQGCEEIGGAALIQCPDLERAPVLVALDPDTLDVLDEVRLPEPAFSRLPAGVLDGVDHVYVTGTETLSRYAWADGRLTVDETWGPVDVLTEGQAGLMAPEITEDWLFFQTNGGQSTAPMTVWAVAVDDSSRRFSVDPFAASTGDSSLQISAMVVDPENGRLFPSDLLVGRLAGVDFDPESGFSPAWEQEQTTFAYGAAVGPADARVLTMTHLTGFMSRINPLQARSEQVVFRDAATGRELARTDDLPRMSGGATLAPGFAGQFYYPAEDGTIYELSVTPSP